MNENWKNDQSLEEDLRKYVARNYQRKEILDFVLLKYSQYKWSMPTLDRRMRHFNIYYINYDTPLERVQDAVREELNGPGKLLGYRALNQKLRLCHDVKVPRDLVYAVLSNEDPEGVQARGLDKKKKPRKLPFTSDGSWHVLSLDGHDKLCGYQNWTFPLGVYGCLDTFSRKIMFLFVCFSNSNPLNIGKKYLEFLYENHYAPKYIRIDRGTETGKMAAMHSYVMNVVGNFENPSDSVIYGPSPTNKIERWWRDLHHRLEKYFKEQLKHLLDTNAYDPENIEDRKMLAYIYIPVIQRECDKFVSLWNSHRIRSQKGLELPCGVPDHMFNFPEKYGGAKDGYPVSTELLEELAEFSSVLQAPCDFLDENQREQFELVVRNVDQIESCDAKDAYLLLKSRTFF